MTEQEAIKLHIAENIHRIEVIEDFLSTNSDANDKECRKNIDILTKINKALNEVEQYRAIGTPEECRNSVLEIPKAYNKAIDDFVEKAMPEFTKYDLEHNVICIAEIKGILRNTAEQLKVGVENEQID